MKFSIYVHTLSYIHYNILFFSKVILLKKQSSKVNFSENKSSLNSSVVQIKGSFITDLRVISLRSYIHFIIKTKNKIIIENF